MQILHTESSEGWGGQEIRILKEAEGMRARGHTVILAVARKAALVEKARNAGFIVYEINYKRRDFFRSLICLHRIIKKHAVEVVNTHSSKDAWLGGFAARLAGVKIVRTRHLSASIRKGVNSRLLYRTLADFIVTTSSAVIPMIARQAKMPLARCRCVPTGVNPSVISVQEEEKEKFRSCLQVQKSDFLVGTVCVVRSWKGIFDFLKAAAILKNEKEIRWVIVGGGHLSEYQAAAKELGVEKNVTFTGQIDSPYAAMASMDVFALLSTANEGISQATLQASYLERPLITTSVGGLPEVCLDEETGLVVPSFSPEKFAAAVLRLKADPGECERMGKRGKKLVEERFLLSKTLDSMEAVYAETVGQSV